ncbi:MAG TPA: hypothetical protein VM532_18890 [Burkholderiales bacterium]|nr:hypothetical protein [Burkholderiales bacterium]
MNDPIQEQTIHEEADRLSTQVNTLITSGQFIAAEEIPQFFNAHQQLLHRYTPIATNRVLELQRLLLQDNNQMVKPYLLGEREITTDFPNVSENWKSVIAVVVDDHDFKRSSLREEEQQEMSVLEDEREMGDLNGGSPDAVVQRYAQQHKQVEDKYISELVPLMQPLLDLKRREWNAELQPYLRVNKTLEEAINLIRASHRIHQLDNQQVRDTPTDNIFGREDDLSLSRELLTYTLPIIRKQSQMALGSDSREPVTPTTNSGDATSAMAPSTPNLPAPGTPIQLGQAQSQHEAVTSGNSRSGIALDPLNSLELSAVNDEFLGAPKSQTAPPIGGETKFRSLYVTVTDDGKDIESGVFRLSNGLTGPFNSKYCKMSGNLIPSAAKQRLLEKPGKIEIQFTPDLPDNSLGRGRGRR